MNNRPNLEVKKCRQKESPRRSGGRAVVFFDTKSNQEAAWEEGDGEQAMMGLANRVMGYI